MHFRNTPALRLDREFSNRLKAHDDLRSTTPREEYEREKTIDVTSAAAAASCMLLAQAAPANAAARTVQNPAGLRGGIVADGTGRGGGGAGPRRPPGLTERLSSPALAARSAPLTREARRRRRATPSI